MALSISKVVVAIFTVSHCLTLQLSIAGGENLPYISFELHGKDHVQLDGDAFVMEENGIQLTDSTKGLEDSGSAGRVVYNTTIPLGNSNFTTHFQFQINWTRDNPYNTSDYGGDGLAFFMASPVSGYHVSYRGDGGWLGLFNPQNNGNLSNYMVAVEFDTYKSVSWDFSNNHIGVDVNNITSERSVNLTQKLINAEIWDARIEYRGQENMLTVSAGSGGQVAGQLSYKINLTKYLPADVVVGFSAAAYRSSEIHRLISWNFTSVIFGPSGKKKIPWKVGTIVGSAILGAVLFVSFATYCYTRRNRQKTQGAEEEQRSDFDIELGHVHRNFKYSELSAGTNNFSEQNRIGQGGFGDVYKCTLQQSGEIVAVKRLTAGSKQGKREYLAEIETITRLRHRNLVQLLGWCHQKGQLLLVYEYMANGSLDELLFGKRRGDQLEWSQRYRIATDIARAMTYLHESGDQCVVHRDIKSANVLLDPLFNAKVGDFGLARLVKHDHWHRTNAIAGTSGYLAPESALTGISNTESDVFSYGAVALEIACGRPALDPNREGQNIRLVEWVWELYGEDRLFDAADDNLLGVFDRVEFERLVVIGLWCSHMDASRRPKISHVLHLLNSEAPIISVLNTLPKATYPPMGRHLFSRSTDFAAPPDLGYSDLPR